MVVAPIAATLLPLVGCHCRKRPRMPKWLPVGVVGSPMVVAPIAATSLPWLLLELTEGTESQQGNRNAFALVGSLCRKRPRSRKGCRSSDVAVALVVLELTERERTSSGNEGNGIRNRGNGITSRESQRPCLAGSLSRKQLRNGCRCSDGCRCWLCDVGCPHRCERPYFGDVHRCERPYFGDVHRCERLCPCLGCSGTLREGKSQEPQQGERNHNKGIATPLPLWLCDVGCSHWCNVLALMPCVPLIVAFALCFCDVCCFHCRNGLCLVGCLAFLRWLPLRLCDVCCSDRCERPCLGWCPFL